MSLKRNGRLPPGIRRKRKTWLDRWNPSSCFRSCGRYSDQQTRYQTRVCRWIVYCPTEVFTSGQECGQIILTRIRKRMKSCLTDISMKRQETIPGHRRMGSFASRRNIFCAEKTLTAGTSKIRR